MVADERAQFATEAGREVAHALSKPEEYLMVIMEKADTMLMGGKDSSVAFCELRGLGLPEDRTAELSALICRLCEKHLHTPPERVYINFFNMPRHMWGWDSKTFG
jgi:phenylpyruvate tautomerase PptA (4-oxalocrotonate tautomerase family)